MNRLELSQGIISCHISHEGPLPSAAYTTIATLAEAIEEAATELSDLLAPEPE